MNFDRFLEVLELIEAHRGLWAFVAVLWTISVGAIVYVVQKWRHRRLYQANRKQEFDDKVCILAFALRKRPNGKLRLSRRVWGNIVPVQRVFNDQFLIEQVTDAASERPGPLRLSDPLNHRLMMFFARTHVAGNDMNGNVKFLTNDPKSVQTMLFYTVASYEAHIPDVSVLERDIGMIELIVISPDSIEEMSKPDFVDTVELGTEVSPVWAKRIHELAKSVQGERNLSVGQSVIGTVEVET